MKKIPVVKEMFHGYVSIEKDDSGRLKPWRVPFEQRRLFPSSPTDESLLDKTECAAGVRLRIGTSAQNIGLTSVKGVFDLVIDNSLIESYSSTGETESDVIFKTLPAGEKTVEIWLPQGSPVRLSHILADSDCVPVDDKRKKWITYGSSITHCGAAHSPARTWPATAARKKNFHLTCLGFGGQCHADPMIAMMIRDMPADFISLKIGINIMGASSLSPRTFRSAIIGMVRIIREKHPDTPIALISPIISPPREQTPNAVGLHLQLMRELVQDACARLVECGDKNIKYYSGLDLFGEEHVQHLPDLLHPDGDGYELLGHNFTEKVGSFFPA